MAKALPARPNLEWLRKTAKQALRDLRSRQPQARLADAQLAVARDHGFSSWRALKTHIGEFRSESVSSDESPVAAFLRAVGNGDLAAVKSALASTPAIVNAVGPNPFWGGGLQMLHLAIETNRQDMFDLAIAHGANLDGDNREYTGWSPLMLAAYKQRPSMTRVLRERGARIGLYEALLLGDDVRVEQYLRPGA